MIPKQIISSIIAFLFPLFLLAQIHTTIADIIENPDNFDGKFVEFVGTVDNIQNKTSRAGNPYTVMTVSDGEYSIKVFSFGTYKFALGTYVRVKGTFAKVKQVGRYTFYNEVDATNGSITKEKKK